MHYEANDFVLGCPFNICTVLVRVEGNRSAL